MTSKVTRRKATQELVISAARAAEVVLDGDTCVVGGSGSLLQVPETTLRAIGERFDRTGGPKGLRVVHVMGLGDHTGRGLDHLAKEGMVRQFIGSHFVLSPEQQRLIHENRVEAIGLPAGTISLLYREIAGGRPGLFTDIGLDTFVDPRLDWGRMNTVTESGISELVTVGEREWLFYPAFDVDVALLRATSADEDGNLDMADEAGLSDNLAIAQAVHNRGGTVIAEVKQVVERGALRAADVRVPGVLVDHVVVTDFPNQTPVTVFDPRRTGTRPRTQMELETLHLDHRKVVARRAAMEIRDGELVNLGVGMANGISYVAQEEGFLDSIHLTVEQGLFGGLPGVGLDSGTAINPTAMIDMSAQFDLYDGGALDMAGLAFAEIDRHGNVNVGRVGSTPIGPGGFIDISQKAGRVVFCGTFRGGGLSTHVGDGRIEISHEGAYAKIVPEVEAITFSAARALAEGRTALYVTERCVFRLSEGGLLLTEIAPGVDLQRDILDHLAFRPQVAEDLALMDERIFRPVPMGWTASAAEPAVPAERVVEGSPR